MKPSSSTARRVGARLLGLLLGLLLASPAAAEEYKLVLTPEVGQAPPARVCLVSRNLQMKADRASGLVTPLASRVTCEGGRCAATRDTRPARCQRCPATPHPDCAASLDLGERKPDDYSVVCADDDTRPPEGGTVYISVESVEAENPPRFYGFEVDGGRVRWSAIERISKPSYRVLGGDFESSRFSYPRVATDQPWAEVPVRRRCRCLEAEVGRGLGEIERVTVNEQASANAGETCRGDLTAGGLLAVEVPAVPVDRVNSLHVVAARGDSGTRWASRWPTAPIALAPRRFEFDWVMPCMWPRAEVCPTASIQGAKCGAGTRSAAVDSPAEGEASGAAGALGAVCSYDCEVIADGAVSPPVQMHLHLDDPAIDVDGILGAVGQRVIGRLPAGDRVVWTEIADWNHQVPGDRIQAIEVIGLDGVRLAVDLDAVEGTRITLPVPAARCGAAVRTRFIGERDYDAGFGRVEPGARLVLPHPDDLAVPWGLIVTLGGGLTAVVAVEAELQTQVSVSYSLLSAIGVRLRPRASSWYFQPQAMAMVVGDWPYTPLTADGGGSVVKRHLYMAAGAEAQVGYTLFVGGNTLHVGAGGGAGIGFDPYQDSNEVVEQGKEMGVWSLGVSSPLSNAVDSPLAFRVELRHWFGSRSLHYTVDERAAVVRRAEPAHAFMLNALLTFAP